MNRSSRKVAALALLVVVGTSLYAQSKPQDKTPLPARSRSDEMLDRWNAIGNKLVAMAQDFPEDKYDYKLQKDERTFALNLLHASSTAPSITASWWCTTAPTTWCRRIRGDRRAGDQMCEPAAQRCRDARRAPESSGS